jgi:hypothetical protein
MNKNVLTIILVALLIFIGAFGMYEYFYGKSIDSKLKAADAKLSEQLKIVAELKAKLVVAEQKEKEIRENAKLDRDSLQVEIDRLKQEKEVILGALEKEKAKTQTLSDSELAFSLNAYVGLDEVKELRVGTFSLSRIGAENGLNIFKEFTLSLQAWGKDKGIIVKQAATIKSFEDVTIPSYERDAVKLHTTLAETEKALSACTGAYSLSKKLNRIQFLKGLAVGAVGGTAVAIVIFSLARVLVK